MINIKMISAAVLRRFSKTGAANTDVLVDPIVEVVDAIFDAEWYIDNYSLTGLTDERAKEHYLSTGFRLGFSPSPLFDPVP